MLPLQNGLNGALRLTTARYYTPSGRSIQAVGVTPDITVRILRPCSDEDKVIPEGEEKSKCDIDREEDLKRREEADLPAALKAESKERVN